jgi:hypothetical protein
LKSFLVLIPHGMPQKRKILKLPIQGGKKSNNQLTLVYTWSILPVDFEFVFQNPFAKNRTTFCKVGFSTSHVQNLINKIVFKVHGRFPMLWIGLKNGFHECLKCTILTMYSCQYSYALKDMHAQTYSVISEMEMKEIHQDR